MHTDKISAMYIEPAPNVLLKIERLREKERRQRAWERLILSLKHVAQAMLLFLMFAGMMIMSMLCLFTDIADDYIGLWTAYLAMEICCGIAYILIHFSTYK